MRWQRYNFRGVPQALEGTEIAVGAYMNRGSENNLFIARDGSFRAFDVIPPGQSGTRTATGTSPHYSDQMPLFTDWRYKPVPFSREESEILAVRRTLLDYRR